MSAEQQLKRAVYAIDDAATALRRAALGAGSDPVATQAIRRALGDLDEAERYIKKAMRELP